MTDLDMEVSVTRTLLGLPDLDINDYENYYVATGFLGGMVTWSKVQATAPYMDGAFTVVRTKQQVQEPLVVECLGDNPAEVYANIQQLAAAMIQDRFHLYGTFGGAPFDYACEAADYGYGRMDGPSWIGGQVQMKFQVPRDPNVQQGVF